MIETEIKSTFKGLYIVPEAATYLTATLKNDLPSGELTYKIQNRNLIHWIRVGLMTPELRTVPGNKLVMSFEDLISMRVIAILRAMNVSWIKIHRAEDWLRQQTGYARPFAVERVWTETEDVFAEFHDGFVAASLHGQLVFKELLGEYLEPIQDMTFVPHNSVNIADSWFPHDDVVLNPRIQYGEPCLKGTRIRTKALWEMWHGGDSIQYLSRAFNLTDIQIEHAFKWEERLNSATKN